MWDYIALDDAKQHYVAQPEHSGFGDEGVTGMFVQWSFIDWEMHWLTL